MRKHFCYKCGYKYIKREYKVSQLVFDTSIRFIFAIWSLERLDTNPRIQIECDIQDQEQLDAGYR